VFPQISGCYRYQIDAILHASLQLFKMVFSKDSLFDDAQIPINGGVNIERE